MSQKLKPATYTCTVCNAAGVKLWREYNTFLDHQVLRCVTCAEKNQGKAIGEHIDQIGWLVPAVPTNFDNIEAPSFTLPEGSTFWGYTSVPPEGIAWWSNLPLMEVMEAT